MAHLEQVHWNLLELIFLANATILTRFEPEFLQHILCSPYVRCIETIYPFATANGIPIKIEYGLSEWFGEDTVRGIFVKCSAFPTFVRLVQCTNSHVYRSRCFKTFICLFPQKNCEHNSP